MIRFPGSRADTLARASAAHDAALARLIRGVGLVLAILGTLYWFAVSLGLLPVSALLLGVSQIALGALILGGMREIYHHAYLERLPPPGNLGELAQLPDWLTTTNFAEYCSLELARVIEASQQNGTFDMQTFFDALLKERTTQIILSRAGLVGELKTGEGGQAPPVALPVTDLDPLLMYAATEAVEGGYNEIHLSHVFKALAEHHQGFANLLFAHRIERADLDQAVEWFLIGQQARRRHFFWESGTVGMYGIGRDWAAGYTPTLSQYATDIARYVRDPALYLQMVGRTSMIDQLEAALSSERQSNALLVGEAGVGKKTIVNGFAARIASGQVAMPLKNKHLMQLDAARLLAGVSDRGAIEARLLRVLNDAATAGNIILFIDNVQTLLAAEEGKVGVVNAAEVLRPFLQSSQIQLVATTTPREYHETIARQGVVAELMTKIEVAPPSPEETMRILQMVVFRLEGRQGVYITVPVIRAAVQGADRYVTQVPRPESAIRVLEAAATVTSRRGQRVVSTADVDTALSELSNVPVGEVQESEKDRLLNLEQVLHERVIGQDEAVTAVAQALRRARSGLAGGNRPIGSFLFLGPTGVGKTETAKALAAAYFGSDDAMVRLDMSEYQSPASLAQLIGSGTDAQEAGTGQLTSAVRDTPFTLVLLDEIEKAHPDILNVFLQVLDEGQVKDGLGRAVSFTNSIIIATSNAGSELIRQGIQAGTDHEALKAALLEAIQSQGIFRPEFLNRFDAVVAFRPLSQPELLQIVDLQLAGLNKRLSEEQVTVQLTDAAKARLAELGYQPEFGARALRRVIQDTVENVIAERLLKGTLQRGQTATLDVEDLGQATSAAPVSASQTPPVHPPNSELPSDGQQTPKE